MADEQGGLTLLGWSEGASIGAKFAPANTTALVAFRPSPP